MSQAIDDRTTPESLLAAARRLFAAGGYDGTSIRAITAEAGANLGAVTYHFGTKRDLYEQVLEQVLAPLPPRIANALHQGGSPLERLEGVVRAAFDQLEENPDQPLLILQEIAAGKPMPLPVRKIMMSTLSSVAEVVAEGQRDGSIRSGDPLMFVLSLISQPVYLSLVTRALPGQVARSLDRGTARSRTVEHAVAFVRAGLASRGPTGDAP